MVENRKKVHFVVSVLHKVWLYEGNEDFQLLSQFWKIQEKMTDSLTHFYNQTTKIKNGKRILFSFKPKKCYNNNPC